MDLFNDKMYNTAVYTMPVYISVYWHVLLNDIDKENFRDPCRHNSP